MIHTLLENKEVNDVEDLLTGVKTLAIVCNQWGDTGKGKFVDFFASWADIIARGTGGANAGHTIKINGVTYVFHLTPSGILFDSEGRINIIGSGVAFDPVIMLPELALLEKNKLSYNNLMIAYNAKLVMPQHVVMDRVSEALKGAGKIGSTGRGIRPVYEDFVGRIGLNPNDMLNKDVLWKKLKNNLEDKIRLLSQADPEIVKTIFHQSILQNGRFYSDSKTFFDIDAIVEAYVEYGAKLKGLIHDTDSFLRENVGKKKILLEGAQGLLLSVDYGSYPYVTSSDCSIRGLAKGVGLSERNIDLVLGIAKAFYMTRVGEGPFPTELGKERSAVWCDKHKKADEQEEYAFTTVNSADEFEQGVAIRREGDEYGATTGRPRRTGWLDLTILRYATDINGKDIILTKVDVLNDCDTIKICYAYEYDGSDYNLGNRVLRKGDRIEKAVMDIKVLEHCKPIYAEFDGWKKDLQGIRTYSGLPEKLRKIIGYVEREAGVRVRIISTGADRNDTIFK